MKYTNQVKKNIDNKLNELFEQWVPMEGKAQHQAGELIRATMRLHYAYYNNGERIWQRDWHNESTDIAANYLWSYTTPEIKALLEAGEKKYTTAYEKFLYQLAEAVMDYIDKNPELKEKKAIDMFSA